IEMRDIGGQPHSQGAAGFRLLSPGNGLSHQQPYQHHEHEPAAISLPLHWCPSCMVFSVTIGAKEPAMNLAPPIGRGLGTGQELRSPQEASSSLETWQEGRHYTCIPHIIVRVGVAVFVKTYHWATLTL